MKGKDSYDGGTKETWREWQWNRIAERLPHGFGSRRLSDRERRLVCEEKTVLYLIGPKDEDRQCAIRRGFSNENLIGIDIDEGRVKQCRKDGGFAVCGSLQQIVMNWPEDWPIDVVVGDFCSGLNGDVMHFLGCLLVSRATSTKTVVSLNAMRGRDQDSNSLRQRAARGAWVWENHPDRSKRKLLRDILRGVDKDKHRGLHLYMYALMCGRIFADGTTPDECVFEVPEIPAFYSYKSRSAKAVNVFDSVVMRWVVDILSQSGKEAVFGLREMVGERLSDIAADDWRIKERIAALRAVRTMWLRKNAG